MSDSLPPIPGYTRADVALKVLGTSIAQAAADPLSGYLEILTEDGLLRLAISGDVAADLRIDLNQFLVAGGASN